jgi:hypothetical protein
MNKTCNKCYSLMYMVNKKHLCVSCDIDKIFSELEQLQAEIKKLKEREEKFWKPTVEHYNNETTYYLPQVKLYKRARQCLLDIEKDKEN